MDSTSALLVAKKLSGDITASEQQQLNELLEADVTLAREVALIEQFWSIEPHPQEADTQFIDNLLKRIGGTVPAQQPVASFSPLRKLWKYAAAAAIIVAIATSIYYVLNPGQMPDASAQMADKQSVQTKPAYRTHMQLVDGTKVWLNADSRITYGADFNKGRREVFLMGEAYFDVVSNPDKPFIIRTAKLNVKVTGTQLNVRAYPNEKVTETALLEGKVEIQIADKPDKIYALNPSEKLVISDYKQEEAINPVNKQAIIKVSSGFLLPEVKPLTFDPVDSLPFEAAWINHTLAFSNETFAEVARKMEKWYDVKFVFTSPALENLRFTGRFEDETLDEALYALQIIGKFNYQLKDKKVIVSP